MFGFVRQKSDGPYTIDFNNEDLKRYLGSLSEKNLENLIKAMDIYYSISIKAEIEARIDNRDNNPEFEKEMKGYLGFRKYLKNYFNEKSVVNR